ncbi:hypothetical protein ElyMa_006460600 [Elysia marginata]|uniref:Pecanex-like protein n=1 Tax=Elysia marginata TaxID=1093978 RepID=A0AAV4HYM8_9GAST|nr:hypothetical protein ElyMa_006460600 [Elysia marginata]
MFVSCISERPDQSPPSVSHQNLNPKSALSGLQEDADLQSASSSEPVFGQEDPRTEGSVDQQQDLDQDVRQCESLQLQKRCYSPPTSLSIARNSRTGLSHAVPKTSVDQTVSTTTNTAVSEGVQGTSPTGPALPVQSSISQDHSSSSSLPTVESSPSYVTPDTLSNLTTSIPKGEHSIELSEFPVVTLTPTENGGQVRVWPVGVGMKSSIRKSGSTPALLSSVLEPSPVTPHPEKVGDGTSKKTDIQAGASDSSSSDFPVGLKTGMSPSDFELQNFSSHSPLHLLRRTSVVKNPYMSPLMAPDELLQGLIRVSIVV